MTLEDMVDHMIFLVGLGFTTYACDTSIFLAGKKYGLIYRNDAYNFTICKVVRNENKPVEFFDLVTNKRIFH